MAPDDFRFCVAVETLRSGVPAYESTVERHGENSFFRGGDDGGKPPEFLLRPPPVGDVVHGDDGPQFLSGRAVDRLAAGKHDPVRSAGRRNYHFGVANDFTL